MEGECDMGRVPVEMLPFPNNPFTVRTQYHTMESLSLKYGYRRSAPEKEYVPHTDMLTLYLGIPLYMLIGLGTALMGCLVGKYV